MVSFMNDLSGIRVSQKFNCAFVILIMWTCWNLDSIDPSDLVNFCWMPCLLTSMTQTLSIY